MIQSFNNSIGRVNIQDCLIYQSFTPSASGGRRIRTFVAEAMDLQSIPFDRSGIPPI